MPLVVSGETAARCDITDRFTSKCVKNPFGLPWALGHHGVAISSIKTDPRTESMAMLWDGNTGSGATGFGIARQKTGSAKKCDGLVFEGTPSFLGAHSPALS
jgi:hypothetical protein